MRKVKPLKMADLTHGVIPKIPDARGGRGMFDQESHSVSPRDGEAYRGKFIHVYNKTRPCLQICPLDDKSMFSIKIYYILFLTSPWNTALPFNQRTSENLSEKLFRAMFNGPIP
jgi:hypothetical protein